MKTIMITGADSGLGFESAKKILANQEFAVILACRNAQKAEHTKQEIVNETGNQNVSVALVDVSSLESVKDCASQMMTENRAIDVLINNAGISPQHSGVTPDGFELVFETNYLGPFTLTLMLLQQITSDGGVIMVSSDMHNPPGGLTWPGLPYIAYEAQSDRARYSYSKLLDLYFAYELARKLKAAGSGITSNAFNPGFMSATNFSGGGKGGAREQWVKMSMPERYSTLEASSTALAEIITTGAYQKVSGTYFDRDKGAGQSSPLSHDEKLQQQVWNESLEMAHIAEPALLK